jgi:hypothetical protein
MKYFTIVPAILCLGVTLILGQQSNNEKVDEYNGYKILEKQLIELRQKNQILEEKVDKFKKVLLNLNDKVYDLEISKANKSQIPDKDDTSVESFESRLRKQYKEENHEHPNHSHNFIHEHRDGKIYPKYSPNY